MTQRIARFLGPFALFEWGAVLTYFYFSHRLSGFLHPSFRPPVLVTGVLLMLAAGSLLFSEDDGELRSCDGESCDHSHRRLTLGGWLGFLVLLLPILIAVKVSPDTYGTVAIQNRGVAESLESIPGARTRAGRRMPSPIYAGADTPLERGSANGRNMAVDIPKGWVPPNAPEFSPSTNVPDTEYPSNEEMAALLRENAGHSGAPSPKKPLRALNERSDTASPFGSFDELLRAADSPLHQGGAGALKQAGDGERLSVEVVDLLIAAQKPALVKALNGKRIELTGQVLGSDGGNFRLMRLLVLCCAADAQPLAVQVKTHQGPKPTPMSWVKVTGKVIFTKKGKAIVPVIAAESIAPVSQPDEPFLF